MKRIYIAALLAATLSACNDRPADATTTGATVNNDTTHAAPAVDSPAAEPIKDIAPKEGEVLLRLNYPKGFSQEVNYTFTAKTQASKGSESYAVNYAVTGMAPNGFAFKGMLTSLKVDSETQGRKIKYDSAKKLAANAAMEEKAIDEGFKGMANKPFTFSLDKLGAVTEEIQFTGQGMLPFDLGTYQIQFPEEPVAVGATWSFKSEDKRMGGTRLNSYTLKKIEDGTVVIDVKSVLPPPAKMRGAKETVFTGTYTLDRQTGMLLNGSLTGFVEALGGNLTMMFAGKKK